MHEGGAGQHDAVRVRPLGRVQPSKLRLVPDVVAGGKADDAFGEAAPHFKGEVHLCVKHQTNCEDGGVDRAAVTHYGKHMFAAVAATTAI